MFNSYFTEETINEFVTNETNIRSCGSCMGGCSNPALCLICARKVPDYYKWLEENKQSLLNKYRKLYAYEFYGIEEYKF